MSVQTDQRNPRRSGIGYTLETPLVKGMNCIDRNRSAILTPAPLCSVIPVLFYEHTVIAQSDFFVLML